MEKIINYRDLDLNFTRHPFSNDVSQFVDTEAVKKAVVNLLSLKRYEKPFHPEINSGIYDSFFDPMNPLQANALKDSISGILKRYEKRIILNNIGISQNYDGNDISITLVFSIINLQTPTNFTVTLVRNR